uniref:Bcl-2-like protein FPV039 n=1 Tax=Fowlpox virus (strain NVSL) TaxID=928301 RepID=UPI000A1C7A30|nr:Chain A, Bcl-2-like protein FPV039 [Fowlpox virus strain NVSL]5TZQ_A Chain A, Bcl-2-like protein FPV039 [Fowlpox virus strain NVSL]5TZQ_B Chain B, Bcl-2-like protein FPV039 [Fowlpox virus strain NVSL]
GPLGSMASSNMKDETYYIALNMIQNYIIEYNTNKPRKSFVIDSISYDVLKAACKSVIKTNYNEFDIIISRNIDFNVIVTQVLEDKINWGRIITIIAFCAYYSKKVKQDTSPQYYDGIISEAITDAILSKYRSWFIDQDYWNGIRIYKN